MNNSPLTASEARDNLYSLIRNAAKGVRAYEIKLRGVEPVVLVAKSEIENWMETLDILSNPEEIRAIRNAKREKKLLKHSEILKNLGIY